MLTALETSRPADMTPAEWRLRLELAACYRVFDAMGWTELIFNHITLRVPGTPDIFLINPFGLNYSEVAARNLVRIHLDGTPAEPTAYPVNRAGFVIHSAVHGARPDAHCVMHIHTTAGIAVACKQAGLGHDDFYGAELFGDVAYHDFEGITVHDGEGPRLAASLGARRIMILRNHGLLGTGLQRVQRLSLDVDAAARVRGAGRGRQPERGEYSPFRSGPASLRARRAGVRAARPVGAQAVLERAAQGRLRSALADLSVPPCSPNPLFPAPGRRWGGPLFPSLRN